MKNTKNIYVKDGVCEFVIGRRSHGQENATTHAALVTLRYNHVDGAYLDPFDDIRPATKADIVRYNKEKGAKWTPYAAMKKAVRTIVKEGFDIESLQNEWEEGTPKAYKALSTLQWAGFRTKEEFLLPYQIPKFALKYERKLRK